LNNRIAAVNRQPDKVSDRDKVSVTLAALFVAQATNTDLTFMKELAIFGVAMLTSKGRQASPALPLSRWSERSRSSRRSRLPEWR